MILFLPFPTLCIVFSCSTLVKKFPSLLCSLVVIPLYVKTYFPLIVLMADDRRGSVSGPFHDLSTLSLSGLFFPINNILQVIKRICLPELFYPDSIAFLNPSRCPTPVAFTYRIPPHLTPSPFFSPHRIPLRSVHPTAAVRRRTSSVSPVVI